jgi:hypothetical protein
MIILANSAPKELSMPYPLRFMLAFITLLRLIET